MSGKNSRIRCAVNAVMDSFHCQERWLQFCGFEVVQRRWIGKLLRRYCGKCVGYSKDDETK